MEKIDVIVWRPDGVAASALATHLVGEAGPAIVAAGAGEVVVHTADTDGEVPDPPLLMGRGAEIGGVVSIWLDSIDDRPPMLAALEEVAGGPGPIDAYLVTESVPQRRLDRDWPDGRSSPGITHFTCFPRPERLSVEEFYRGWHDVHTPASFRLHPLRWEYVRDAVVRPLTSGSRPLAAIVLERFREVRDYADPSRLYGGPEAMDETMRDLPLYADLPDIDSRPLWEHVVLSR